MLYDLVGIVVWVVLDDVGLIVDEVVMLVMWYCVKLFFWDLLGDVLYCEVVMVWVWVMFVGVLYVLLMWVVVCYLIVYVEY